MSRVRYGQRGYCGASKSVRAAQAEASGRYPLSRAVGELAEQASITRKTAKSLLEAIGASEWHHVSKYANVCNFYDADTAVWLICSASAEEIAEELLPDKAEALLRDLRQPERLAAERAAYAKSQTRAAKAKATREARLASARAEAKALEEIAAAERRRLAGFATAARMKGVARQKAFQLQRLIRNFRADPTPGRASELQRVWNRNPEEVLRGC